MLAERATHGFVAGVDPSAVMVEQAAKRNREFIRLGRVELKQAAVSSLPYEYRRFTKVCAANNYQFWPSPEHDLDEIKRVMQEGGLLVLCLRMKHPTRSVQLAPGFTEEEVKEIQGLVRWVGFREVRTVRRQLEREITCVMANR